MNSATLTFESADGRTSVMQFFKEGDQYQAKIQLPPNMSLMETCVCIGMLLEIKDQLISTFTAHGSKTH